MLETLVKRKQIELDLKLGSLENELAAWCERANQDGPLEKHQSQLLALQAHLNGWHTTIRAKLNQYKTLSPAAYLSCCANAETLILSEHRIWEYFRSKLIQRNEKGFIDYLRAADEFAWSCYRPVQKTVYPNGNDAQRKEPPLVFFNGGLSPFSVSRGKSFQPETVAGEVLNLDRAASVTKLPVPVVGVPWDQVNHLPAVLVIGHEAGHIVEDDFGLRPDLTSLLESALAYADAKSRADAWHSWLGETFADLYGCLAGGPAFAGALIDFLIKGKEQIGQEEQSAPEWGDYPTAYLRVKFVLAVLEKMNFAPDLTEYEKCWAGFSSRMPKEYVTDIPHIACWLLKGEQKALGNKSIQDIFSFSEEQQAQVKKTCEALLKIGPDTQVEPPSRDIRVLFASARLAYEKNPAAYVENDYSAVVLDHIINKVVEKGVRFEEAKLPQSRLTALEKAGAEWANSLMDAFPEPVVEAPGD